MQPLKSLISTPISFILRKVNTLYTYINVDYERLNKVTIKNRYPPPLSAEKFNRLLRLKLFSKIDIKDADH
jgi:hypothetical protein